VTDFATLLLDQFLGDGKAQAGSFLYPASSRAHLAKFLKDDGLVLRAYSDT